MQINVSWVKTGWIHVLINPLKLFCHTLIFSMEKSCTDFFFHTDQSNWCYSSSPCAVQAILKQTEWHFSLHDKLMSSTDGHQSLLAPTLKGDFITMMDLGFFSSFCISQLKPVSIPTLTSTLLGKICTFLSHRQISGLLSTTTRAFQKSPFQTFKPIP